MICVTHVLILTSHQYNKSSSSYFTLLGETVQSAEQNRPNREEVMNDTRGKTKVKKKRINCQRLCGVYSSIPRQHPFLSVQEKWKMLDIFQPGNHRPKSPSEVININLSLPSFKQSKRYGFASSVLNNKLIPSGTKSRTK